MAGAGSTLRSMILLASDYPGSQCQLWYPSCWPSLKRRRQHWLLPRCKYHYGTFRDVLSWWSELWFTGIVHTFLCANILYKMNEIWLASPDKCYFLKATCADWPLVVKLKVNTWPVQLVCPWLTTGQWVSGLKIWTYKPSLCRLYLETILSC